MKFGVMLMSGGKNKVVLECVEVSGTCPVYRIGSRIIVDECLIWRTDECPVRYREEPGHANCYAMLADFVPYFRSLCRGVSPRDLGLTGEDGKGYVTCKNLPVDFYFNRGDNTHGSVKFRISLVPVDKNYNDLWDDELKEKKLPPHTPR